MAKRDADADLCHGGDTGGRIAGRYPPLGRRAAGSRPRIVGATCRHDHRGAATPAETALNSTAPELIGPPLWLALGSALLGGLILNLMPCVLPVLALKVLHFVEAASGGRRQALLSAIGYASGIVVSFVVLAAVLIALRAAGDVIGWGFQLQNPFVIAALAALFLLLALNLFGVFGVGLSLTRLGSGSR